MCGRYAAAKSPAMLANEFAAVDRTGEQGPSENYNIAPTDPVVAVLDRHPRDEHGVADPSAVQRSLRVLRWGLVPHWAKDTKGAARMINARAESVHEKSAFKASLASRRCVLPADGWYEWRKDLDEHGKLVKQPYFMTRQDGASLAMAGIWAAWHAPDGGLLLTAAVLTTAATGALTEIHDRMPLVLPEDALAHWLDPDSRDVTELLRHPDTGYAEQLELRPVSARVNSVRNNGAALVERHEPEAPASLFEQP
ncbi:SOS response-associated peptidase [Sciscionella sediminilitoris]|uniref:SOS response-associated peptidase n=1 Tax=Sciscionella sediminilitoris TaxID=1445613 RepID=UPI0004DFA2EC|nr:SOS response-associated peptidase [Sciscionella sp. SE31]